MNFIVKTITSALAIIVVGYLMTPHVQVDNTLTALILAVVLAALNQFIKPILIILTLPITVLTLGLFLLVVNTIMIMLASALVRGFTVESFWWAMLFSIILSIVNSIFSTLAERKS
ncbi:MAG: phage holin family protein [Bacteroidia bacterium]|nr:phage holin family protein [Bacteroidia bacterium]MCZ2276788.1 phage holin family protein [Bacteroidia bacterium]